MPTGGAPAPGPAPVPSTTKAARSRRIHPRISPSGREGAGRPASGPAGAGVCLVVRGGGRRGGGRAAGRGGRVGGRRGRGRRAGGGGGLDGLDAVAAVTTTTSMGHGNLRFRGSYAGETAFARRCDGRVQVVSRVEHLGPRIALNALERRRIERFGQTRC